MKKQPTIAELEILQVLWEEKTATVREVYETVSANKPLTYTTILKLMQIMTEKGLVERKEQGKAHLYRAKIARDETQKSFLEDLIEKVFCGSAMQLVQHIVDSKKTSPEEMKKIRKMINQAEKEAREGKK